MESVCDYSAEFHLLPSHLEAGSSGYIQYDYRVKDQSLSFPYFDLMLNKESERVISINEKNYLISEADSLNDSKPPEEFVKDEIKKEENNIKPLIHIFFNLEPSWSCENSNVSDKKTCKIQYPLNDSFLISFGVSQKFIKSFLKDHILADAKCFRRDNRVSVAHDTGFSEEYSCDCKALDFSRDRLELMCDFDSNSLMELRLRTNHPQVYFFNKEEEGNKQTPLRKFTID